MLSRGLQGPKKQFRNLKYKLLGIDVPPKSIYLSDFGSTWSEKDTLHYLRQTRALARAIISELGDMTDLSQCPLPLPKIQSKMARLDVKLLAYSDSRIPTVAAPNSVETVVKELTAYKYSPREQDNITQWLYGLLGPHSMRSQMTAETYNHLIGYSLRAHDINLALYILDIMKSQNIMPDRISLHLFLKFNASLVATNPYPAPPLGHPLINTHLCIKKMKGFGVKADQNTWNLVLQCMPFGFGKSFLLEEMDKRRIPLTDTSKRVIFETIVSNERDSNTIRLIDSLDINDPIVFRMMIDHLLTRKTNNNENVTSAWLLLTKSQDFSREMFHIFLTRFARRKHLDWLFGILSHFKDTPWDSKTWELFIEAASFTFETAGKSAALGTILKQAERENIILTTRSRLLARRAMRRLSLRDLGPAGWRELCQGLSWKHAMSPSDPDLLKSIGFSANGRSLPSSAAHLDSSRFEAMPRTDSEYRRLELLNQLKA